MATSAAGESSPSGTRPPGKPPELQSFLNRHLFHPLARRLAVALSRTPATPNMVSVFGAILVLAAGACYAGLDWPEGVAIGFALHLLWHVVDGADGDLARLTGRASPFGEMVDGACDYVSHALLYFIIATILDDHIGFWAYPLGFLSGFSRVAQANHAESQRRIYMWRAYGVPWLQQATSSDDDILRRKGGPSGILRAAGRAYVALAQKLTPTSAEIDAAAEWAARDPEAQRRLARLCRCAFRRPLFMQMLIGANPRTVLLGFSMATGFPLLYFLVETTLLNLLLLLSLREQKKCNARLAARLANHHAGA